MTDRLRAAHFGPLGHSCAPVRDLPCVKLPNGGQAYVDPGKVRDYLLSDDHLIGQHKARAFRRLGFERHEWFLLLRELLRIAREGTVVDRNLTIYGIKYVVDDRINGQRDLLQYARSG